MGTVTGISWTDSTWNPWMGCHKVSAGCKNCYMFRDQKRYGHDPNIVRRAAKATFNSPLHWTGPRRVFTCSWSDFFIEEADKWRREAWDIIWTTPHLTYQILTKRPERIAQCLPSDWGTGYPNVWLGISAENQQQFDERARLLYRISAVIRFISAEPLLGRINLHGLSETNGFVTADGIPAIATEHIHWVIAGGESGFGYRVVDTPWIDDLRKQCHAAHVPFFLKQLGGTKKIDGAWGGDQLFGNQYHEFPSCNTVEGIRQCAF